MSAKKIKIGVKLCFSAGLLLYIFQKINWQQTYELLQQVNLSYLALSCLFAVLMIAVVGWKFVILTKGTSVNHSLLSFIRINFIARFYSLFLPSGVGVEVIRYMYVTKGNEGRVSFLIKTLFERFNFIFLTLSIGLVGLWFAKDSEKFEQLFNQLQPWIFLMMSVVALAMLYLMNVKVTLAINRILTFLLGWLPRRLQSYLTWLHTITEHHVPLMVATKVVLVTLVWQVLYFLRCYSLFLALAVGLDASHVLWISALVLLLQGLPISFAGLGVREGALVYLFGFFEGIPNELGFIIGGLLFMQMLIIALIGAILQLYPLHDK